MTGGAFGSLIAQLFQLTARRAQDAARRRRRGRHVGDVRRRRSRRSCSRSSCCCSNGSRAASCRSRSRARPPRRRATFVIGRGPAVPDGRARRRSPASTRSRAASLAGLAAGGFSGAADARGLRVRGSVQARADPLDVVAGDRRARDRHRRPDLPARARRRLRRDRRRCCTASYAPQAILVLVLVKGLIWSISLGSGTSGGVLAPLLMMGGALGGAREPGVPRRRRSGSGRSSSMGAILGGTMRSPLTGDRVRGRAHARHEHAAAAGRSR